MRSILTGLVFLAATTSFAVTVGAPAPTFTAKDSHGKTVNLADFKGKYVVLEWHNSGCPYVKKHYSSGNMQKLQSEAESKGAVWLTVISSAKGKEGYETPAAANAYMKKEKATPSHVLMDSSGAIGHLYSAKTTPHMFVVDPNGNLIYDGAIDDHESTDASDIPQSKNYVMAALSEAMAGKPVSIASTKPYGCGVKY